MKTVILHVTLCLTLGVLNPPVSAQTGGEYRSWTLRYVEPSDVRRMLLQLLGDRARDARIIADDEENQLLLKGSQKTQELADELIREVDRSASDRSNSQPQDSDRQDTHRQTGQRAYVVKSDLLNAWPQLLRNAFGPDAEISVDRRNSQLLIQASPAVHQLVQELLGTGHAAESPDHDVAGSPQTTDDSWPHPFGDPSALFAESENPVAGRRQVTLMYRIQHYTADQYRTALKRLLGEKLKLFPDDTAEYTSESSGQVRLRFDSKSQSCELNGDRILVAQFLTLFGWFERLRDRAPGQSMRLVPLRNVRPDVLNRAIRLWHESRKPRAVSHRSQSFRTGAQPRRHESTAAESMAPHRSLAPANPAMWEQDNETGGTQTDSAVPVQTVALTQDETTSGDAADDSRGEAPDEEDDLRPPLSDVSVQPFPGLDVLALTGSDADVQELIRIIREIERLSEEAVPQTELYFLEHVHASGLNVFIRTVLDALTDPLHGRVAMTPISKPNAVLIIGWGEAVEAAKKLIAKLDQPVSPDRDMRIFPLKNSGVAEAVTALQLALKRTGGLAPSVAVTPNPRTNSLIVYASPRDMQEVERLIRHLDAKSSSAVNKGRMIRLKNSLATDVATTITNAIAAAAGGNSGRQASELEMLLVQPDGREVVASGVLNDVVLTPDVRTNTIFVTGPEGSLSLVEQLIAQLDESPAAAAVIKVFEIANGNAADLVTVLRTLFPVSTTGSGVPALATAEGESSLVPVRFSVDARTNTIIATGTSGDLQVMEALLIRLDEVASQERVNQVYHLRNTPAEAVAQAVNEFLLSERIVSQAAPGRQNPFAQIQQEVVVVPELVRNQLIISATPRFFDQIMELVEDLDSKPAQVMIQVILAEVHLNSFHEFGVELGLQDSLLFDRSLLGDLVQTTITTATSTPAGVVTTTQENIVAASHTPGFNFNNSPLGNSGSNQSLASAGRAAGQGISHFSLGRTNTDLGYGGLVLSASSENVSVLLRALDRSGSVEILSRPQIMTLDNQEAFIQVGQSVPRIASSSVTQFGQTNSIAEEQVGLLLGVIPRINPDNTVVMQVDATKSEVGPESEGIPIFVSTDGTVVRSPRVNITSAQTTVSAVSGQTIVIGGLITTSNLTDHRKVPWLGDLPMLGKLFRYDSFSNRRSELLIILTPHVVLGHGDTEYLKQVEMARMSWVSSDVFEFIGPESQRFCPDDDSGVEVIFPDSALGVKSNDPVVPAIPDLGTPRIDPVPTDSSEFTEVDVNPDVSVNRFSTDDAEHEFGAGPDETVVPPRSGDSALTKLARTDEEQDQRNSDTDRKNRRRFFGFGRRPQQ